MPGKDHRLSKKKDFENVFKKGRSSYDSLLGIKAVPNRLDVSRFGILVGTKISKKAVVRNRIRRRIREVMKKNLGNMRGNYDLVIITLPEIRDCSFDQIKSSVSGNLQRLRIINKQR